MFKLSAKIIPALFFWGIFIYVVLQIPYPDSLTQADSFQIFSFFIPLFLALTFSINFFLNFFIRSILISACIIVLLILQALESLNILTFILTTLAFGLFISYFKKVNLTSRGSIPKLKPLRRRKR